VNTFGFPTRQISYYSPYNLTDYSYGFQKTKKGNSRATKMSGGGSINLLQPGPSNAWESTGAKKKKDAQIQFRILNKKQNNEVLEQKKDMLDRARKHIDPRRAQVSM
jgi:hypothetical protein